MHDAGTVEGCETEKKGLQTLGCTYDEIKGLQRNEGSTEIGEKRRFLSRHKINAQNTREHKKAAESHVTNRGQPPFLPGKKTMVSWSSPLFMKGCLQSQIITGLSIAHEQGALLYCPRAYVCVCVCMQVCMREWVVYEGMSVCVYVCLHACI